MGRYKGHLYGVADQTGTTGVRGETTLGASANQYAECVLIQSIMLAALVPLRAVCACSFYHAG